MAMVSRYRDLGTFEVNGNDYPRRYKRVSKSTASYVITVDTPTTFDLLSLQQYGSPLMFWLIADFNDYIDATVTIPAGTRIKIPRI